uniref:Crustacean hyperglycemic hormone protein n=1 Tax=Callinectes arcuatus TaxID=257891 RepID=A0A7T1L759_CALAT|nr:crustacean hyperglycemic hormone protein [Callinectes arcuatus]
MTWTVPASAISHIPTMALVMTVVMVTVMNGGAASPVKPPHSLGDAGQQHRRAKRDTDLVHDSCKGYYDRDTWNELSHVCEDCDNLYREFGFQEKCKRGCFASELFVTCLYALGKDVEIYQDMATSLRGS